MFRIGPLELDESQFQAACTLGNTLVIAGPGAGKTRTLLGHALYLLDSGIPPERIFLLTFTVKTASELQARLKALGARNVKVDTFHGFAYELCRLKGKNPRLLEPKEQEEIFKEILRRRGMPVRGAFKKLENLFTCDTDEEGLLTAYEETLLRENLWDFRRLIKEASRENPLRDLSCHLLVDEFQDLNPELLSFLRSFTRARFYFVGDPAQAIYGFRGAKPEITKAFMDSLNEVSIRYLLESYRVPEKILAFASNLQESPFETPPLKARKMGGEIKAFSFKSPEQEARGVAEQIEKLLGGLQMETSKKGFSPAEIAVVARLRRLLVPVRKALEKVGIPVEEGSAVTESILAEVEKALSHARNLSDLRQKLSREILSLPEISFLLEKSEDLEDFSGKWHLFRLRTTVLLKKSGVSLLTIHETKGLEFKVVFLVGAEEDIMPFRLLEGFDFAEEKRLAYVAVTRAEAIFWASFSRHRSLFGKRLPGRISPFFSALPLCKPQRRPSRPKQRGLF